MIKLDATRRPIPDRAMGAPATGHSTFGKSFLLAFIAYAFLSATALSLLLYEFYRLEETAAGILLKSFARVTAEQTSRTIQNIDETLEFVDGAFAVPGNADTDLSVERRLRDTLSKHPYMRAIWIVDGKGIIVGGSEREGIGLDISDRPYFRAIKASRDVGLIVSPPLVSRVTGKYAVPIARARRGAEGEFIGAVVATIDTAFFVDVWTMDRDDQAIYFQEISFEFLRRDGRLIMRVPFAPAAIDVVLPSSPYSNDTAAAGIFRTSSSIDGVSRLAAFHQLSIDRNYVIVVGRTLESVFASWWRALWISLPAWAGTTGILGGLALWLARTWRSREMAELENRRIFETSEDVILVTDGHGKIVRVSPSVGKRLGYRPDEVVGHDVSEFVASQDVERMRKEIQAATDRNIPLNLKIRYVHKDGHAVPFNWVGAYSESDGRSYFIGRDTTDQDRIEAQLRQSQKMESIGQLTGGIAHDFNNILMVILANVDALREEEDVQPEVQSGLDEIAKATERATELTRSLLAFSRKQPLNPEVIDINDLIAGTGAMLRRTLGEHVEVKSVLAEDLWPVEVDRAQLQSALINLCLNARDAMPDGGLLLIETRNATLDDDYAEHNPEAAPGTYAMLAVSDTGIGIPPEVLAKVFEPFFTTKGMGKGTGLGLSMVYGFVKQSGGHIKIYSEPGHGTTVKIYLRRSGSARPQAAGMAADPMLRGNERVLVVEDNEQLRIAVVRQVESLGYAITEARDGAAGLAACEAATRPYDLLLTDVIMPGPLNGKALADEVTRRWPTTRVLFMSGYTESAVIQHGRLEPGVQLLAKPFRKADLAQAIRRVLDGTRGGGASRFENDQASGVVVAPSWDP